MSTDNSGSLPAQKRNRSPTPTTVQPFKRLFQRTLEDSFITDQFVFIMNSLLAEESQYQNSTSQDLHSVSAPSDIEMKDCTHIREDHQATQLTIHLEEGD